MRVKAGVPFFNLKQDVSILPPNQFFLFNNVFVLPSDLTIDQTPLWAIMQTRVLMDVGNPAQ